MTKLSYSLNYLAAAAFGLYPLSDEGRKQLDLVAGSRGFLDELERVARDPVYIALRDRLRRGHAPPQFRKSPVPQQAAHLTEPWTRKFAMTRCGEARRHVALVTSEGHAPGEQTRPTTQLQSLSNWPPKPEDGDDGLYPTMKVFQWRVAGDEPLVFDQTSVEELWFVGVSGSVDIVAGEDEYSLETQADHIGVLAVRRANKHNPLMAKVELRAAGDFAEGILVAFSRRGVPFTEPANGQAKIFCADDDGDGWRSNAAVEVEVLQFSTIPVGADAWAWAATLDIAPEANEFGYPHRPGIEQGQFLMKAPKPDIGPSNISRDDEVGLRVMALPARAATKIHTFHYASHRGAEVIIPLCGLTLNRFADPAAHSDVNGIWLNEMTMQQRVNGVAEVGAAFEGAKYKPEVSILESSCLHGFAAADENNAVCLLIKSWIFEWGTGRWKKSDNTVDWTIAKRGAA